MITDTLRTDVWNNMIEAIRISRYYDAVRNRYETQHLIIRVFLAISGVATALPLAFPWAEPAMPYTGLAIILFVVIDAMADRNGKARMIQAAENDLDVVVAEYRQLWSRIEDADVDNAIVRDEVHSLEERINKATGYLDLPTFPTLIEKTGQAVYAMEKRRYA